MATMVTRGFWCYCYCTDSSIVRQYGALSIARDPAKHELTKHIGVDASFVCAAVQAQTLALHYVPSELQLVDFFTKAQTRTQHGFFLSKLSVVDPP